MELGPLVKYIDFSRIDGKILDDIIKPLKIIPTKIILNVDCQQSDSEFRGIPIFKLNRWSK